MPGVLIIEAMAQAAAFACTRPGDPEMNVVIARISEMRFHRPVTPGDQLVMESEVLKDRGNFFANRCRATVDGHLVTEFEILASVIFPPKEQQ
jgi:3-hydroxymyristoyl/3-hydroxydecanoyl-(acyl carrier protein) dehydratase